MRNVRKFSCIMLIASLISSCGPKVSEWQVESPDGKLKVEILSRQDVNGDRLFFTVLKKNAEKMDTLLFPSPLGLERKDQSFLTVHNFKDAPEFRKITDNYNLTSGKQKKVHAEANEISLSFVNNQKSAIEIVFRAYNDGVAFRYIFPGKSDSTFTVTKEYSAFAFGQWTSLDYAI
jgi:alpha-glucosidase